MIFPWEMGCTIHFSDSLNNFSMANGEENEVIKLSDQKISFGKPLKY